jgi:hypothetical protein
VQFAIQAPARACSRSTFSRRDTPDPMPSDVLRRETHMSWVFAGDRVYKLETGPPISLFTLKGVRPPAVPSCGSMGGSHRNYLKVVPLTERRVDRRRRHAGTGW